MKIYAWKVDHGNCEADGYDRDEGGVQELRIGWEKINNT